MKRRYFLLLTFLLSQTTLAWGMDIPEEGETCTPFDPRCKKKKATPPPVSCSFVLEAEANTHSQPYSASVVILEEKPILSKKLDQEVLSHLHSFGLPLQEIETIWGDFGKIITAKMQTHPFCLASNDPHFIATGLWKAHFEIEALQSPQHPLPLKSVLSCLLTKSFSSINRKVSLNEVHLIKNLIQSNPYFRSLELFKASLTDTHLSQIGRIPHLQELSLEENDITDKGIEILLVNYPNLQKLNLGNNNITSQGVTLLAKSPTLKHLNLYKNPMGDKGAEALSHNTVLEYLDLRDTGVGDQGAQALSTNNKTLTDLRLRYNNITDKGAETFLNCYLNLSHLELERNQISKDLVFYLENLFNAQ